jgi:hypothetical protein
MYHLWLNFTSITQLKGRVLMAILASSPIVTLLSTSSEFVFSSAQVATELECKFLAVKVPVAVIVKISDVFETYKDIIGTIVYPANKLGKVIYFKHRK